MVKVERGQRFFTMIDEDLTVVREPGGRTLSSQLRCHRFLAQCKIFLMVKPLFFSLSGNTQRIIISNNKDNIYIRNGNGS